VLGETISKSAGQEQALVEFAAKIGDTGCKIHIPTDDGIVETCTGTDITISRIAKM
jgi:hypothetical protein